MNGDTGRQNNIGNADRALTEKLMFRLLPVQVLIVAVGTVNGVVSSLFASNLVGPVAMSAIGLYFPITLLIQSINIMLCGGSTIICGRYIGKNQRDMVGGIFSLDIVVTAVIGAVFTLVLLILGSTGLTGLFTKDTAVKYELGRYLVGQAAGIIPTFLGYQLSAFLSLENRMRRNTAASIVYIAVNILFNYIFVKIMALGVLGVALSASLGMWVYFLIEAQYFLTSESSLHFSIRGLSFKEGREILSIGFPGAASNGYQTLRGFIVNRLIEVFVGAAGISAFAACNSLLAFFWAVPLGMINVSRMMISVSAGEEDRRTLADVMRTMFFRFLPLQCLISAAVIALAGPLTGLYYKDAAESCYRMTEWGFRILPLCMPLSIIMMHFVCYAQTMKKQFLAHILSVLDGVVCVSGFTALLIGSIGMNSVYIANVLNGVVTTIVIILYSVICRRKVPKNMEELMVIPDDFGADEDSRLDISVTNEEEVVKIAEEVQAFCMKKGVDNRRSGLAALALEEMAGNVVSHGFSKDHKKHTVDVRVVYKDNDVTLRIKDDCVHFDPFERFASDDPGDITKNIGIRMIYKTAEDVQYQNILGLNVLTVKI